MARIQNKTCNGALLSNWPSLFCKNAKASTFIPNDTIKRTTHNRMSIIDDVCCCSSRSYTMLLLIMLYCLHNNECSRHKKIFLSKNFREIQKGRLRKPSTAVYGPFKKYQSDKKMFTNIKRTQAKHYTAGFFYYDIYTRLPSFKKKKKNK